MPTPEESSLAVALNELVGNLYGMYAYAHGCHWNVEGALYASLHEYFDDVQGDVFGSIDGFSEALRFHQFYAPYSLSMFQRANAVPEVPMVNGNPVPMFQTLISANSIVLQSLFKVMELAEAAGDPGLSNYCQDRINQHNKHAWQFRSHLKQFD